MSVRFVDEVNVDASSDDPDLAGDFPQSDWRLGSRSSVDLAGSFVWKNVSAHVGVNNVSTKDPPLTGADNCALPWCNGNTFPQVCGRYGSPD